MRPPAKNNPRAEFRLRNIERAKLSAMLNRSYADVIKELK
jgi:hypothetical protein